MIDYEALRDYLEDELFGAAFGGGFGGALMETEDLDDLSDEELLDLARSNGFDPENYE